MCLILTSSLVVDLKENTEYHGYNSNAQVIKWFWEVMEDIDQTQKANFLQFVTGIFKYNS